MRRIALLSAVFAAASLVASPGLRAEDGPPAPRKPPGDVKDDTQKDQAGKLRVERAAQAVKDLEEAIARVKAAQPIDAILLSKLMEALDQAKALAKPAKPEELTTEEKKAVVDDAKAKEQADPNKPKDPMTQWQDSAISKAFEGADLSEEEEIKARKIVGDWYKESLSAMGDSKKTSDLKKKRDDDLEKALGKKKQQKISNNLNAMGPGRR